MRASASAVRSTIRRSASPSGGSTSCPAARRALSSFDPNSRSGHSIAIAAMRLADELGVQLDRVDGRERLGNGAALLGALGELGELVGAEPGHLGARAQLDLR